MTLILNGLPGIPLIQPGDNLGDIIRAGLLQGGINPQDGDILVLAQKIVSKSENRLVNLTQVEPSTKAYEIADTAGKDPRLIELILKESRRILRVRAGVIIVEHRLGFVCANAGIDHSNVSGSQGKSEDWVLLLPENPDESAAVIRKQLESFYAVRLGVLIIDSHGRAWRMGTAGISIGISGLPGLVDLRGREDLFGYKLQITQVGAADELAAAASLIMGQSAEGTPIIHVSGFPYPLRESSLQELIRPENLDLFR